VKTPKSIQAAERETYDHAARIWVLAGAKPGKYYSYVENRWVEISLKYNGEEAPPRRREADKESDFLAAETDARRAATAKRLEDLGSDRSAHA
jgi:hypothetical protein